MNTRGRAPLLRFALARAGGVVVTLNLLIALAWLLAFYAPVKGQGYHPPVYLSLSRQLGIIGHLMLELWTLNVRGIGLVEVTTRSAFLEAAATSTALAVGSIAIAAAVGVPLGVWAALHRRHWLAHLSVGFSVLVGQLPPFAVGVLLLLVFSVWWRLLPPLGWGHPINWVLPLITLATVNIGYVTKFAQTGMNHVLREGYLAGAAARGMQGWRLLLRHALRPALVTLLLFFGPQTVTTIFGVILVEDVLQVPGMASMLGLGMGNLTFSKQSGIVAVPGTQEVGPFFNGGQANPAELVVASIFIVGALVLLLNFVIDLVYHALEPRSLW
jgi:ABC-type dipeptide/oligopeptide/nickel transport system permease component